MLLLFETLKNNKDVIEYIANGDSVKDVALTDDEELLRVYVGPEEDTDKYSYEYKRGRLGDVRRQ